MQQLSEQSISEATDLEVFTALVWLADTTDEATITADSPAAAAAT